jgi:hypothetical protein
MGDNHEIVPPSTSDTGFEAPAAAGAARVDVARGNRNRVAGTSALPS